MTSLYFSLTRFCFNVPYAICIEKKNDPKKKKKKKIRSTCPNFFEHVTPNTHIYIRPKQKRQEKMLICCY